MEDSRFPETCLEHHVHDDAVRKVRALMPDEEKLAALSELYKIFGDVTRIRILASLHESEMCVCDIAEALGMSVSAISHQLRLLKQAKLVRSRREGKTVYYALSDSHVESMLMQGLEHISE